MIIGSGDIASVLQDREGAIFFASGVSNSKCTDSKEFQREKDLLKRTWKKHYYPGVCLFYFSTISINFIDTPYTSHKMVMELMVRGMFPDYNIIRLGNISWGTNPHTFYNYLKNRMAKPGKPPEIRDEYKYMISQEQLLMMTNNLPLQGHNRISVFGDARLVKDILNDKR